MIVLVVTLLLKLCQQHRMEKPFACSYHHGIFSDGAIVVVLVVVVVLLVLVVVVVLVVLLVVTLLLKLCQQHPEEKPFAFRYAKGLFSDGVIVVVVRLVILAC